MDLGIDGDDGADLSSADDTAKLTTSRIPLTAPPTPSRHRKETNIVDELGDMEISSLKQLFQYLIVHCHWPHKVFLHRPCPGTMLGHHEMPVLYTFSKYTSNAT
jgi:hypothetical protein